MAAATAARAVRAPNNFDLVYEAALKAFADLDILVGNTVGTQGVKRIEIAVVAYVAPAPSGEIGTQLGVSIIAQGREVTGPRRAPLPCASTGLLERRVRNKVQQLAEA